MSVFSRSALNAQPPRRLRPGSAFSLLEVVVAVGVFAIGIVAILALFAPALSPALPGGALTLLLLVPVIAFGSLYGDLFESAIKREVGVKDAGSWLPGFGGILDRIDSLLITVPAAYWLLRIVEALSA